MSDLVASFEDWLPEVAADRILVDTSGAGLSGEANANCWSFSVTPEQASSLSPTTVVEFLLAVRSARSDQLLSRFGNEHAMTMYCWADGQVASINLSLVSASHGCIPFGAPVELVDDLLEIVDALLNNPYHDGIPLDEFKIVGKEAPEEEAKPPRPVRVWITSLPD